MNRKEAKAAGVKTYYTGKPCKHGHVSVRRTDNGVCCECDKIKSKSYKEANKESIREQRKKYASENREAVTAAHKNWRQANREKLNARRRERRSNDLHRYLSKEREYHSVNRDRIRESRREYYRVYATRRRANDPTYKVHTRMRDFNRRCVEAIKGVKNWRTADALGYTPQQLREHLESLWEDGMSWDNYGEWHIDHVKSISSFVSEGVTDVSVINAMSNLQPLWAFDNLSKGA